jgi:hypothetical protein
MPNALTQPTGAQILAFLATAAGERKTIGTMNEATIDALIASNEVANPVTVATDHIRSLFADPDDLDTPTYQEAYPALMNAILHDLLRHDMLSRQAIPNAQGGGVEIDAYRAKMDVAAGMVGVYLFRLGIKESRYHYVAVATGENHEGRGLW